MRILLLVLLVGCEVLPPRPPVTETCANACANLRRLGCPEGEPTEAGASCEQVCDNAQASPAPLPTGCVAQATTCDAATNCTGD
jgi:hypothetical protein